jgi:hypothetical protein
MPFLVILLLFIAAQVFDAGQRLEEDVEGLI